MSALVAIRKARPLDEYPPLRLVTVEDEVLPVIRVERCACEGWIRQHAGDDQRALVAAHNATPEHAAWRARP